MPRAVRTYRDSSKEVRVDEGIDIIDVSAEIKY